MVKTIVKFFPIILNIKKWLTLINSLKEVFFFHLVIMCSHRTQQHLYISSASNKRDHNEVLCSQAFIIYQSFRSDKISLDIERYLFLNFFLFFIYFPIYTEPNRIVAIQLDLPIFPPIIIGFVCLKRIPIRFTFNEAYWRWWLYTKKNHFVSIDIVPTLVNKN